MTRMGNMRHNTKIISARFIRKQEKVECLFKINVVIIILPHFTFTTHQVIHDIKLAFHCCPWEREWQSQSRLYGYASTKTKRVVLNEFCTSEHSGTHVDAPIHFARDTWALDEIPLEHMWRVPGVLIDVSQAAAASKERNYAIPVEELEAWENRYGVIPDFSVVLLRTGWGAKSHDIADYSGLDAERKNNFPGLSEEAATWLATHGSRHGHVTGVVGVGIDTISVDVGNSTHYKAHNALYSRNLYGMENMNNLDKLPPHNFLVTVMPMRIGGGSGAPARIIAEMSDEPVGMPMHRQHVDSAAMGLHAQAQLLLVGVGLLLIPRRAH
ncbi:isatin hydrolase-like isoform X3 [Eriocheir sinensis]|uniref:isatin hydrolase-like isoform X3 n=1 Tax=Eriocheir sinensis TaxID=95602 RepID=UPI0021C8AE73|nr:isatin hydrolase-like isoform X3 [Eriocheir sinensis]